MLLSCAPLFSLNWTFNQSTTDNLFSILGYNHCVLAMLTYLITSSRACPSDTGLPLTVLKSIWCDMYDVASSKRLNSRSTISSLSFGTWSHIRLISIHRTASTNTNYETDKYLICHTKKHTFWKIPGKNWLLWLNLWFSSAVALNINRTSH